MKPSISKQLLSDKIAVGLIVAIIVLVLARILILPLSPPGFYVDEAATGAHVVAMVTHQTNAQGQAWPFFSQSLSGGFTTPVYLYPLSLWSSTFGFSEIALRYFSQFITIIAILFMTLSMRLWLGKRAGLIAAIVGLALPWGWLQGSLAWDPVMVPIMISLAIFGFSLLMTRISFKPKLTGMILLPTSLIFLAYSYPPYWASAPILFLAAYITLYVTKRISIKNILITGVSALVLATPLLFFILQPNTLTRTSTIGIFHGTTILQGVWLFFQNILLLVNPVFLFISGDSNLRHSVGLQGMLGFAALIPIGVLVWFAVKKHFQNKTKFLKHQEIILVVIGICGFIISLIGSALTNEAQPQSLRACGAWPFAVILLTVGWCFILRQKNRWLKWVTILLFIIATLAYSINLAFFFPSRSAWAFNVPERTKILSGQALEYSPLGLQYYKTR